MDASTRGRRLQRALAELDELRDRLAGPKTRLRERAKVEEAVERILSDHELSGIVAVQIDEREEVRLAGRPQ